MDVLRIALLREQWQCLAEDDSPACVADVSQVLPELSAAPRPAPAKMAGPWKVFDVTAVPFPDDAAVGVPAVLLIKDMPDTSPCLLDADQTCHRQHDHRYNAQETIPRQCSCTSAMRHSRTGGQASGSLMRLAEHSGCQAMCCWSCTWSRLPAEAKTAMRRQGLHMSIANILTSPQLSYH